MSISATIFALATATIAAQAAPAQTTALPAASPIIALPLNPVVGTAQRSCTLKTASGLGYTMLREGSGAKPSDADVVLINYIGYLAATGDAFDQAMTTPMPVDGVISGFAEGLKLAAKGAVVRLCIPSVLGYGAQGTGPIPANSDLVFQVETLDFKSVAEIEALRKQSEAKPAD